jgi:hypothetical protein
MVMATIYNISRAVCDQKVKDICSVGEVGCDMGRSLDELVEVVIVYVVI